MTEETRAEEASIIETKVVDSDVVLAADETSISVDEISGPGRAARSGSDGLYFRYIWLPAIFLTSALLGGLRINGSDGAFVFFKPPLICLMLATALMLLAFRGRLLQLDGWFSETLGPLKNAANAAVLAALFAASTQVFNSLLPESGLPLWVVGFCFVWTLWNNLFSEFDPRRTIRSLAALFGFAFVVKYLVLANLTAPTGDGWVRSMIENPGKEALTWLLDLPRFSGATGYIQFFTLAVYFVGLYLLPANTEERSPK
jgi:hypothetical protein